MPSSALLLDFDTVGTNQDKAVCAQSKVVSTHRSTQMP